MFHLAANSRMRVWLFSIVLMTLVAGALPLSLTSAQNPFSDGGPSIVPTGESVCSPKLATSDKGERYVVAVDELNLRSGPSTDCDIVAELKRDTELVAVGESTAEGDYVWVPV
ncbi:MAG TPA: SH3 domain-containing protein, partial [Thermomicrobiales bacterium]|nr:SH3 domain-containing protein [Thermomicrobiales bacterium]